LPKDRENSDDEEDAEELLENDEISAEEEGFLKGAEEAEEDLDKEDEDASENEE